MKAIIFGVNGQDGFYLNELLLKNNIEVIGVSRRNDNWLIGNVANYNFVEALIKQNKPDFIFHLAANSTTYHGALFENHETISTGSINILEAVYKFSNHTKIFLSGSGLQFKNEGKPISERDAFEGSSPYSVSRIYSTYAARYYRQKLSIKVYIGFFFNHDSPLRPERHINQKIITAAKNISKGIEEKFKIGNIDIKKEFMYAGDAVNAIWKLVSNDEIFETVIGSGKAYSIKDWIALCFNYFDLDWEKYIIYKEDFIPDYKILVSDPSTLFKLGWNQSIEIEELARMMIENASAEQ